MASDIVVGQNRSALQTIKTNQDTAAAALPGGAARRRSNFTKGLYTANGDGSTTVFNIPHGLVSLDGNTGKTPSSYNVDGVNAVSQAAHTTSKGSVNIVYTFTTAPVTGTGNVQLNWQAWV